MLWANKDIAKLTNAELLDARHLTGLMYQSREAVKENPRFATKFAKQPFPDPNPAFVELRTQIDNEIKNRGIV